MQQAAPPAAPPAAAAAEDAVDEESLLAVPAAAGHGGLGLSADEREQVRRRRQRQKWRKLCLFLFFLVLGSNPLRWWSRFASTRAAMRGQEVGSLLVCCLISFTWVFEHVYGYAGADAQERKASLTGFFFVGGCFSLYFDLGPGFPIVWFLQSSTSVFEYVYGNADVMWRTNQVSLWGCVCGAAVCFWWLMDLCLDVRFAYQFYQKVDYNGVRVSTGSTLLLYVSLFFIDCCISPLDP